jgi:hypothetical protein
MENNALITIRRFNNEGEAQVVKSLLESAGFECYMTGEYNSQVWPTGAFPCGLCVRAEDAERAVEFLAATPEN